MPVQCKNWKLRAFLPWEILPTLCECCIFVARTRKSASAVVNKSHCGTLEIHQEFAGYLWTSDCLSPARKIAEVSEHSKKCAFSHIQYCKWMLQVSNVSCCAFLTHKFVFILCSHTLLNKFLVVCFSSLKCFAHCVWKKTPRRVFGVQWKYLETAQHYGTADIPKERPLQWRSNSSNCPNVYHRKKKRILKDCSGLTHRRSPKILGVSLIVNSARENKTPRKKKCVLCQIKTWVRGPGGSLLLGDGMAVCVVSSVRLHCLMRFYKVGRFTIAFRRSAYSFWNKYLLHITWCQK